MTDDKISDSKNLTSARALAALRQMQHCIGVFEAATSAMKAAGQQMLELNAALWDLADENEQMRRAITEYADARGAHAAITRPRSGFARAAGLPHGHPAVVRLRVARAKMESLRLFRPHALYKKEDTFTIGVPTRILDANGDVVLSLCKACGKAERDLLDNGGHCVGSPNKPEEDSGNEG